MHAGGDRFESDMLHHVKVEKKKFVSSLTYRQTTITKNTNVVFVVSLVNARSYNDYRKVHKVHKVDALGLYFEEGRG